MNQYKIHTDFSKYSATFLAYHLKTRTLMGKLTILTLIFLFVLTGTTFNRNICDGMNNESHLLGSCLTSQNLPYPTGSYRVGTTAFHLVDTYRKDLISKKPGHFREVMIQVWYPTDSIQKSTAPYITNVAVLQVMKDEQYNGLDLAVIEGFKDIQTYATLNAPLSNKKAKFPLLFFSHGLGEPRSDYTGFSQNLASHGYLVACVDHPYGGYTVLPDGRVLSTSADPEAGNPESTPAQVELWAKDVTFILNYLISSDKSMSAEIKQIAKRVDLSRVGMLGHSLGGAAALEACRTDTRFKACADLDGFPFGKVTEEGVKRPTLMMNSGPIYSDEDLAKRGRTREQWEKMGQQARLVFDSLIPKKADIPIYFIKVNGAGHMSFSDAPFVMPTTITRFGGRIIDAKLSFEIISNYLLDFFDKYLNGKREGLLDKAESPYPELSIRKYNL